MTEFWSGGLTKGGRERHIAVDALGLIITVVVTAASVQDCDAARPPASRPAASASTPSRLSATMPTSPGAARRRIARDKLVEFIRHSCRP